MMPERKSVPIPAATAAATAVDPLQTGLAAQRHVFVYGTLRAGGSNDITRYRPAPQWVGRAAVVGTLYDFGGWPGLRLSGDQVVVGEVWRIDPGIEPLLDRLEDVRNDGCGEYRKRWMTLAVDGSPLDCLVYEVNADRISGRPVIASGDWIAHRRSNVP